MSVLLTYVCVELGFLMAGIAARGCYFASRVPGICAKMGRGAVSD